MNIRPDHPVGSVPLPLVKKPLGEIRDGQDGQKQTREKRHEPGLGRLKGSKAELEAPEANYEGKGDPNQIVDKVRFFHRIKFSSESFVWSGKENTSTGRKLQEEKRLALFHFCEGIRGSEPSDPRERRGDSAALRETTRRWSFHGLGRSRRPSASLRGNPFGFADESGVPSRCFRESRRRPRAQSKPSSQKHWFKVGQDPNIA